MSRVEFTTMALPWLAVKLVNFLEPISNLLRPSVAAIHILPWLSFTTLRTSLPTMLFVFFLSGRKLSMALVCEFHLKNPVLTTPIQNSFSDSSMIEQIGSIELKRSKYFHVLVWCSNREVKAL